MTTDKAKRRDRSDLRMTPLPTSNQQFINRLFWGRDQAAGNCDNFLSTVTILLLHIGRDPSSLDKPVDRTRIARLLLRRAWPPLNSTRVVATHAREVPVLEKLEFMIALAREKHFGRAAESCGVAQPTLSQGVQQLEEMLGVPLVKRSSRFLGFTPEGERVLVWARRLVGDAHAMRQEILGMQRGHGAQLRIAAMPAAMPLIAALTAPFQLHHPTVRFALLTRTFDEIAALLNARETDAGVR